MHNSPVVLKQQNKPFDEKTYQKVLKVISNLNDKKRSHSLKPHFIMNKMVEYLKKMKFYHLYVLYSLGK